MRSLICGLLVAWFIIVALTGCTAPAGSERAATSFLKNELQKWLADQKCEVRTIDSVLKAPPIDFSIISVHAAKADFTATSNTVALNYDGSAYRYKVKLTWVSQAKRQLTTVADYKLTWNQAENRWYVSKGYLADF